MPVTPYFIFGRFSDKNGNAVANTTVFLTNENSGDVISASTNENGDYEFDCANFVPDWKDGDVLTLSTGTADFEFYASHNGGLSWYQVENQESYAFDINSSKVKIDKTKHSGGRDIIIIYPI